MIRWMARKVLAQDLEKLRRERFELQHHLTVLKRENLYQKVEIKGLQDRLQQARLSPPRR